MRVVSHAACACEYRDSKISELEENEEFASGLFRKTAAVLRQYQKARHRLVAVVFCQVRERHVLIVLLHSN